MNKELYNEVKEKIQGFLDSNDFSAIGSYLNDTFNNNKTEGAFKSIYKAVYEISSQNSLLNNYVSWSKESFNNFYKNKLDSVMIDKIINDPFELDTIISMGSDNVFDENALKDIYDSAINVKNVTELAGKSISSELQACIDKLSSKLNIVEEKENKPLTNKEYNAEIERLQAEKKEKNAERIAMAAGTLGVSEKVFEKQMNKNNIDIDEVDSYIVSDKVVDKAAANSAVMTKSNSDVAKLIANIKNKHLLKTAEITIEDGNVFLSREDTKAEIAKQVVVRRTTEAKTKIASVSKSAFNHINRRVQECKEKLKYVGQQVNNLVSMVGLPVLYGIAAASNTIDDAIQKMNDKMKELGQKAKDELSLLDKKAKNWEADKFLKAAEALKQKAETIRPEEIPNEEMQELSGRAI